MPTASILLQLLALEWFSVLRVNSHAGQCLSPRATPFHVIQARTAHVKIQVSNTAENVILVKIFLWGKTKKFQNSVGEHSWILTRIGWGCNRIDAQPSIQPPLLFCRYGIVWSYEKHKDCPGTQPKGTTTITKGKELLCICNISCTERQASTQKIFQTVSSSPVCCTLYFTTISSRLSNTRLILISCPLIFLG